MAITTTYLTGFEHGFSGTSSNMALGAGLIAGASGSGITVTAGAARNGSYGLHCNAPLNTPTWISATISGTKLLARFAVKVSTLPSSGTTVVAAAHASGRWLYLYVDSNGQLSCQINAGSIVTGATINTTNWHLIELQADVTGTPATVAWKVDGVTQSAVSTSSIADTWATFYLGSTNSSQQASVADYDDFIVGNWTSSTDWYGEGQVLGQLAGSDGTHATVGDFSPGDATAAFSGTVTTAYTYLDSPPATSGWTNSRSTTDNLGMRTANTSAYMEIKPVTTAHTGTANAVRALLAYSSSSTSANLAACDVRNSAGTVNALRGTTGGTGATYNVTGNNYAGALISTPVAGWTATEVNAIKMRFGGCTSSDINPVPTIQEWMLEVDWPVTVTNAEVTAVTAAATSAASTPIVGVSEEVVAVPAAAAATAPVPAVTYTNTAYPDLISSESGLVSYWRLGEVSGNALDSKDSNPGTTVGSGVTRNVAGLLVHNADGAVQGDGTTNASIAIPSNANMDVGAQLSLEFWIKPTALHATQLANPVNRGVDACFYVRYYSSGDGRWEFNVKDTNNVQTQLVPSPVAAAGVWQHVVMTYDAAGAMNAYINGVSDGTPNRTPNANVKGGAYPLILLNRASGSSNGVNGVMDEVALYNVALTPTQVADHYRVGSGVALFAPPSARATSTAPVPTLTIATNVTIAAVTASATAGAPIPTSVTASASPTIVAVPAIALAVGPLPTLVNARAPPSAAGTSTAPVPTVVAVQNITLSAVVAGASAAAPVSTVSAIQNRTVTAVPAPATSAAPAPTVAVSANITLTAVAASASSTASVPTVVAGQNATVTAVAASATAAAPAPRAGNSAYEALIGSETGLISYWRLGEASGNALDSKDSNPGTTVGSGITRNVAGLLNSNIDNAAAGDGTSNSYITIPSNVNMDVGAQLSVEFWIKPTALHATNLANPINRGTDACFYIRYLNAGDGRWDFHITDGNAAETTITSFGGSEVAAAGKVQHIAMTYDAAGTMKAYINGVSAGLQSRTPNANVKGGTFALTLFNRVASGPTSAVNGVMDEVALYNTALTQAQVQAHYDLGAGNIRLSAVSAGGAATAPLPSIAIAQNATVSAVSAGATATAPGPNVTSTQNPTIVAVAASASAAAPVPSVFAGSSATITAVTASATATAPTPTVLATQNITLVAVAAGASATAPVPTVQAIRNISVSAVSAGASASAPTPTVTAGVSLAAPPAGATASAPTPQVTISATILAPSASGVAGAPLPALRLDASVDAPSAEVTASSNAEVGVGIDAPAARVLASAPRYRVSGQQDVDLIAPSASGSARAPSPTAHIVFRLVAYLSDVQVYEATLATSHAEVYLSDQQLYEVRLRMSNPANL